MKNNLKYFLPVLLVCVVLVQCRKEDPQLIGDSSTANFNFVQSSISDTLPYTLRIAFTNTSTGEFLYQWNFGDGSALSSEKSPTHTYANGGVFDVRLTTVGTNGNNSATKRVNITSACNVDAFNKLTGCSNKDWTWSLAGDAIKILAANGINVDYSGATGGCQADDVFTFGADGKFTYDAKGQTFDVQAGYSCQAPKANSNRFRLVAKANQLPQILLDSIPVGRPFIGTTDIVVGNKYEIRSYDDNNLTLRGALTSGQFVEIKLRKVAPLTAADAKQLLTGGSTKAWKLDGSNGANAIVVGVESNPARDYQGGPLADCQKDDKYTFNANGSLIYDAAGSTFNGGNITVPSPYICGIDRSFTGTYTFGSVTGGVAGIASIQLLNTPPNTFIGTTDVPSENVYRIIDISANSMLLRAGNGSGAVFQFKMVSF